MFIESTQRTNMGNSNKRRLNMFVDDGFDEALARARASLGATTDSEVVRRTVEFMGYVGPLMKDN